MAFTADTPTLVRAADSNGDPDTQAYRAEQRAANRERREKAWKALDAMVADAAHPAHFNAARVTLDRLDGMPTQKSEVEIKRPLEEMSEDELATAIELVRASIAAAPEGT